MVARKGGGRVGNAGVCVCMCVSVCVFVLGYERGEGVR